MTENNIKEKKFYVRYYHAIQFIPIKLIFYCSAFPSSIDSLD